jgi:hypothetical protein
MKWIKRIGKVFGFHSDDEKTAAKSYSINIRDKPLSKGTVSVRR